MKLKRVKELQKKFFVFVFTLVSSLNIFAANIEEKTPSIEIVKEFWDRRPCNIKHSPSEFGTRKYFDEVEKGKYFVESHIPGFADFDKWKGKNVLEIGCGIGIDSINFARAGAELTVIELSKKSMEITKKRFEVYGLTATFIIIDGEKLSTVLPEKHFDLVYSFGVIHHIPHPEKVIDEVKKVIKTNGEFRMMVYSKYSTKNMMIGLGLAQPEAQFGCPIANTYSKKDIVNLLSGFKVYSVNKDHIFSYKIAEYKQYVYKKRFPWNLLPQFVFHGFEKTLGWHCLVKAIYNEDAKSIDI